MEPMKTRTWIGRRKSTPSWLKISAVFVGAAIVVFAVIGVLNAIVLRPENPTASLGALGDKVSDALVPSGRTAASPGSATSVEVARTALDGASGTAEVNLFESSGNQRFLDMSDVPDVVEALSAFQDADLEAGFVVYDFKAQRGLGYNADAPFFSASTIKAPYVAYVLQTVVDGGQAALGDEIPEDIVQEGTGIMAFDDRDSYDLGTVIAHTIIHSDNTGYALLREHYDRDFEAWARAAGVDTSTWDGEWYPYYTPRDLADLWLTVGRYAGGDGAHASWCKDLLSQTGTSFIRQTLGADHHVMAKAGYEVDRAGYAMNSLNDAGIVQGSTGDYLIAVMSNAGYDDEYYTEHESLITDLVAALSSAHDRLLAA